MYCILNKILRTRSINLIHEINLTSLQTSTKIYKKTIKPTYQLLGKTMKYGYSRKISSPSMLKLAELDIENFSPY